MESIITTVLNLGTVALEYLKTKNENKARDLAFERKELREEWYAEFNKGKGRRSNFKLDGIRRKLLINADAIYTASGLPAEHDKPNT